MEKRIARFPVGVFRHFSKQNSEGLACGRLGRFRRGKFYHRAESTPDFQLSFNHAGGQLMKKFLSTIVLSATVAPAMAVPSDFGIRRVVFSFRSETLQEFEQYARLAKEAGATHVDVSQLPGKSWWQRPDRSDPYPQWAYINPSIFKAFIPEKLRGHIPSASQEKFMTVMQDRCAILRRLGLKGYFKGGEPVMLPESVYIEHPLWRGPRVDKPTRSRNAQYAPAVDNPEVRALYREAMAGLIRNCPEIEIFRFLTNDSGTGLDWHPNLYPGVNGNTLYSHIGLGERVAGFLATLQQGAEDAGVTGVEIAINGTGYEARPNENIEAVRSLGTGMVLENRMMDGSTWSSVTGLEFYFNSMFPLLGIPQHLRFVEELEQATQRRAPVLICFIDVEMGSLYFDLFQRFFEKPTRGPLSRQILLRELAEDQVGKKAAFELTQVWNGIHNSVQKHMPINYGYGGHIFLLGTIAQRWLTRPFVPFGTELTEEEFSYYRPFQFQGRSVEHAEDLADLQATRFVAGQGAARIISVLMGQARAEVSGARSSLSRVFKDLRDMELRSQLELLDLRLRAYSLVCRNAVNAVSYQEKLDYIRDKQIKPDFHPRFALDADPFRLDILGVARSEIDNTALLIEILENSDQKILHMTEDPKEEDSFAFGPDLVEQLRKKIRIMHDHWLDYDRIFTQPN